MSYSTLLGVVPDQKPAYLMELRNAHGWAPSIWGRLLRHHGHSEHWMTDDAGLIELWEAIDALPYWQQVPLVLTFDTGVIPWTHYTEAAELLREFDARIPAPPGHVNHVQAVADFFAGGPDAPLIGIWGTSVSENPFEGEWNEDLETYDPPGIPFAAMYLLQHHRRGSPAETWAALSGQLQRMNIPRTR